ncbi:hypothetical protein B0T10DRAFT_603990 [Thelonectria olida]|uniref:Uncharacterized protein n=1 Tax=Thelonectria olida TaxID=1576542 RepID=A0A9P8WBG9_9HYPO|nr:hypothetical protein B0T10DRAFT_603990 [Thelonectria olida]
MCIHIRIHLTDCETRRPVLLNHQTSVIVYHPFEEPPACAHQRDRDAQHPCESHGSCCWLREGYYCFASDELRCQGWQEYHTVILKQDEARFAEEFFPPIHPDNARIPDYPVFHHHRLRKDIFDAGALAWEAVVHGRRAARNIVRFELEDDQERLPYWRGKYDYSRDKLSGHLNTVQAYRELWNDFSELGRMEACPVFGLENHLWRTVFQVHDHRADTAQSGPMRGNEHYPLDERPHGHDWQPENPLAAVPQPRATTPLGNVADEVRTLQDAGREILALRRRVRHLEEEFLGEDFERYDEDDDGYDDDDDDEDGDEGDHDGDVARARSPENRQHTPENSPLTPNPDRRAPLPSMEPLTPVGPNHYIPPFQRSSPPEDKAIQAPLPPWRRNSDHDAPPVASAIKPWLEQVLINGTQGMVPEAPRKRRASDGGVESHVEQPAKRSRSD